MKFNLNKKGNNEVGYLIPLELNNNLYFLPKRIFYTYGVPTNGNRGAHAYHKTEQVRICISGSLKLKCFDGREEVIYQLNSPDEAVFVEPHIWRTTFDHSKDAVLLVLSSLEYNEDDYIRDYDKFMEVVSCI